MALKNAPIKQGFLGFFVGITLKTAVAQEVT
jgi:hypothetical protein